MAELDSDALMLEPAFDRAVVGVLERCGQPVLVVYDHELVIEELMRQGLEYLEAVEHFEFNIAGAWVGERTPGFLTRLREAGL